MAMLSRLLEEASGAPVHDLRMEARPLRGGLESRAVVAITARFRDREGRPRLLRVVAKHLSGRALRELSVYGGLVERRAAEIAPRVLGIHVAPGRGVLFLESLRRSRAWPWSDTAHAAEVLRCVARLHQAPSSGIALPAWDYDAELARSAVATVEALERMRGSPVLDARRSLPALRRVARDVAAVRRRLADGPLPTALLHGDLHPGNVVVRRPSRSRGAPRIALIDWERARLGSPLEDVSSFLQSLAYWEPRVRARHDTLLGDYLEARGFERRPTRELRDAYWLAGATNALAGALAYHAGIATSDAAPTPARERAAHAARDWLRVVRRADWVWSTAARSRPYALRGRPGVTVRLRTGR